MLCINKKLPKVKNTRTYCGGWRHVRFSNNNRRGQLHALICIYPLSINTVAGASIAQNAMLMLEFALRLCSESYNICVGHQTECFDRGTQSEQQTTTNNHNHITRSKSCYVSYSMHTSVCILNCVYQLTHEVLPYFVTEPFSWQTELIFK